MSPAPALTEAQWQARVVDLARRTGWMVTHSLPAYDRTGTRVRTAVQGQVGFPDLVLARSGTVLVRELKTDTGRLSPAQRAWLAALGDLGGVWRPRDWSDVQAVLTAPRPATALDDDPAPHPRPARAVRVADLDHLIPHLERP